MALRPNFLDRVLGEVLEARLRILPNPDVHQKCPGVDERL
jgi:hypothetical protein